MIGREAYHNPYLLAELGQLWNLEAPDRFDIMEQMLPYIEQRLAEGAPLSIITSYFRSIPKFTGRSQMATSSKWWKCKNFN